MDHDLIYYINVLLYRNISAITFGPWWKFHVDMLLTVIMIIRFGIWPFFLGYELSRDLVEYNSYKYYLTKFTFRREEEWPGGVIYTHYTFILSKFKTRNRKNLSNLNTWAENIKLWKSTVIVDILDLFWLPEITRYKVFK